MAVYNWYVTDFETITRNTIYYRKYKDTKVILGYTENAEHTDSKLFIELSDYINWLRGFDRGILTYFHNLSFDVDFIKKFLWNHTTIPYSRIPIIDDEYFSIQEGSGKTYQMTIQMRNTTGMMITHQFKCSYHLLSSSVAVLGKSFGIEKMTKENSVKSNFYDREPYTSIESIDTDYLGYVKSDVRIVIEALKSLQDNLMSLGGIEMTETLTAGGIARALAKKWVSSPEFLTSSEESFKLASKIFTGGFAQFNPDTQDILTKCEKGFSVDLNSAHPNSMTKLLPYGDPTLIQYNDIIPNDNEHLYYVKVKVGKAVAKTKVWCLKNWNKYTTKDSRNSGRYSEVLENFTGYYPLKQWEMYSNFYEFHDVTYDTVHKFKASHFLKPLIEELYKLKEEASKIGDEGAKMTYKIILNSLYGSFAIRPAYDTIYHLDDIKAHQLRIKVDYNDARNNHTQLYLQNRGKTNKLNYKRETQKHYIGQGDNIFILEDAQPPEVYSNKMVAVQTTSNTLMDVLQAILDIGVEFFLYTDTDSLFVSDGDPNRINLHDSELGAWKVEHTFDGIYVLGAKAYYLIEGGKVIKETFSGVATRWLNELETNGERKRNMKQVIEHISQNGALLTGEIIEGAGSITNWEISGLTINTSDYKVNKRGN